MALKQLIRSTVLLAIAACGSETIRNVPDENPDDNGVILTPGTDQPTKTDPNPSSCKAQSETAKNVPLHLVVVLDCSGSMSASYQDTSGSASTRFDAVRNALVTYSKSAQVTPVYMSVVPFGLDQGASNDDCSASYYTPAVKDTLLPNGTVVTRGLAGLGPEGLTPTAGGVLGGEAYAKQLKNAKPGENVVLVLATDGEPTGCGDMSGANSAVSKAKSNGFPTYVIGVGDSLTNLNQLATSGGTAPALIIDGNSATVVTQKLNRKLEDIRSQFACDLQVPAKFPDGSDADKSKINVQITDGSGAKKDLVYSQDCTKADAFRYDNAANPTKVELCDSTCTAVRADRNAVIDLLLGCPSKVQ